MSRIFVSYRRSDTEMAAGRLAKDLRAAFGEAAVFRDKENIPIGADWVQEIRSAIGARGVVLVLIGDEWAEGDAQGRRRIDDPQDTHRNEIAAALQLGCLVVPVLVGNARMPDAASLPEPLRRLTQLNAVKLRDDEWDGFDFPRLAKLLQEQGFKAGDREGARPGVKTSAKAIASLVVMTIAGIGVGSAGSDPEEHLGSAFVAMVALGLAVFAYVDIRTGKAKGQTLAILGMVLSALVALGGLGNSFPDEKAEVGQKVPTSTVAQLADTSAAAAPNPPPRVAAAPATPQAREVVTPALPPAAVNLSGRWLDAAGGVAEISHSGRQVVIRDLTPGSPFYGVVIAGVVQGRVMEAAFELPDGPVVMRLALAPDDRHLIGAIAFPSLGTQQPYALQRAQ